MSAPTNLISGTAAFMCLSIHSSQPEQAVKEDTWVASMSRVWKLLLNMWTCGTNVDYYSRVVLHSQPNSTKLVNSLLTFCRSPYLSAYMN